MFGVLFTRLFVDSKKVIIGMLIGLLLVIFLQFIVGPYRWQMVPIYFFAFVFIIVSVFKITIFKENRFFIKNKVLRVISNTAVVGMLVISLVLASLLPVKDLPELSGSYTVGVMDLSLTDNDREESFTSDAGDYRNLSVTVWYPTEDGNENELKTYWDEDLLISKAVAEYQGLFSFTYSHLSLVKTNSHIDAPVSSEEESFPVLIYSHSNFGINTENTMLYESLASNGYIVFSINHTYESIGSLFPNGEIIPSNSAYLSESYDSNIDLQDELFVQFDNADNIEEKNRIIEELLTIDKLLIEMVNIRTADAIFVLDELEIMNSNNDNVFFSKIDLEKIGMFGWSLGGATSEETCIADSRGKACANMDGYPYGELFQSSEFIQHHLCISYLTETLS